MIPPAHEEDRAPLLFKVALRCRLALACLFSRRLLLFWHTRDGDRFGFFGLDWRLLDQVAEAHNSLAGRLHEKARVEALCRELEDPQ